MKAYKIHFNNIIIEAEDEAKAVIKAMENITESEVSYIEEVSLDVI